MCPARHIAHQCRVNLNETLPKQGKMAALRHMVNNLLPTAHPPRPNRRYFASVKSGDQEGSEAKAGVGTGNSTRPVTSTM